jgi:penicillin-binding protein 1B
MNFETNDQDRLHTIVTRLPVTRQNRFTRHKRFAAIFGLLIFFCALITGFALLNQYSRHAAFISERLADHSLLLLAGIYTAPRHIVVGRQMACDELSEQLLRAGYLEGSSSGEFVSGTFTRLSDGFEIRTHQYLTSDQLPDSVRISFVGKSGWCVIAGIQNTRTQQQLEAIALPAEMLTADLSTRRQARRPVSFAELPPQLVNAITAIEDCRFFEHSGIDLKAMVRALLRNWRSGEIREGGSTITQQFIRNQFLPPERSYERKLSEAMMVLALADAAEAEPLRVLPPERIDDASAPYFSEQSFQSRSRRAATARLGLQAHCLW